MLCIVLISPSPYFSTPPPLYSSSTGTHSLPPSLLHHTHTHTPMDGNTDVSARAMLNIHDCEDMHRLHSILANLYDPVSNPGGVVNLGVAENVRNSFTLLTQYPPNLS